MSEMYFEERLARVRAIVARLEDPEVPLEEGMQLFQEGMRLCRQCDEELKQARLVVEEAMRQEGA
jgi:exodeoxyribonuclease VII small subunit